MPVKQHTERDFISLRFLLRKFRTGGDKGPVRPARLFVRKALYENTLRKTPRGNRCTKNAASPPVLTFFPRCSIIYAEQAGLPRSHVPKGLGVRKVRAPQGRITDNVRRRRLPGKCNRNSLPKLPHGSRYRWKGEVKAHRHGRRLRANVNPIRSNTAGKERAGPAHFSGGFRRTATCAADRWQSRGKPRTEPGLQARSFFLRQCRSVLP